jgi:predicted nuclease of predicted toxin-antitoxin system
MKFKLDENFGTRCLDLFAAAGHDTCTVWIQQLQGATDDQLFAACMSEHRILVTLDLDFCNLLRYPPAHSAGLAVLRLPNRPSLALLRQTIQTLLQGLDCPLSRQALIDHGIEICQRILNEQIKFSPYPECIGGFTRSGRTTPTAVRLEGLLAALEFIPKDQTALRTQILTASASGIRFLVRSQIKSGSFMGGIPGSIPLDTHKILPKNDRSSEIRIDYVRHALCAMLRYRNALTATSLLPKQ